MSTHDHPPAEQPGRPEPAQHYRFHFLFSAPPNVAAATIEPPLAAEFEKTEIAGTAGALEVTVTWGGRPERFTISAGELDREAVRHAIEQSWQWRDAERAATGAPHVLEIVHHLDSPLAHESRIALMRRFVAVLLRHLTPQAVHLAETMQIADPSLLHEAFTEDPYDPLFGFMNIRFYKVEGHDEGRTAEYDETIMDTLGLHALGLTDLQVHFKHLDPSMVAKMLDDTAHYLLEKGAVIENGHSLRGFTDDQKFLCTLDGSILDPWRAVVDVDPGRPYSITRSSSIVV